MTWPTCAPRRRTALRSGSIVFPSPSPMPPQHLSISQKGDIFSSPDPPRLPSVVMNQTSPLFQFWTFATRPEMRPGSLFFTRICGNVRKGYLIACFRPSSSFTLFACPSLPFRRRQNNDGLRPTWTLEYLPALGTVLKGQNRGFSFTNVSSQGDTYRAHGRWRESSP